MGSLCSKSSDHTGGHTVLASSSNTLGGSSAPGPQSSNTNPREAAALAAEQRMNAAKARGTNASNPNKGKLASKLAESKKQPANAPGASREDQLVWD
ncbi:hypothetical protein BOTBODRAFT_167570 [Botryobasidium botryosum FD-172 SS1]|uniref:Uncharacterized protein n=1 Tax=Botryobasidium botryosum (strain FD-172 SS1) TaxID=930990 RepID=A0A067LUY4_BOTB1|nr:hypothetical protein BOTBODRAFT_167570 [Botryobasidium botryosum FD-172 SS1]